MLKQHRIFARFPNVPLGDPTNERALVLSRFRQNDIPSARASMIIDAIDHAKIVIVDADDITLKTLDVSGLEWVLCVSEQPLQPRTMIDESICEAVHEYSMRVPAPKNGERWVIGENENLIDRIYQSHEEAYAQWLQDAVDTMGEHQLGDGPA